MQDFGELIWNYPCIITTVLLVYLAYAHCLLHFENLKVYLVSILISILIDLYLITIRGIARNYRNGAQMQQDCVSTTGETRYRRTSASLCSSKNHVSLLTW